MSSWELTYTEWNPENERLREALCTLGNGYIAVRGASEESCNSDHHYHGTYLAGGYNRAETFKAGKIIQNEDLVNWPDFTGLTFRVGDEGWFNLNDADVHKFTQTLDLKCGILRRDIHFTFEGRESRLSTQRLVSMDTPHLAGFSWELTPLNWEGEVEILSSIDGSVRNSGVERYRELNGHHHDVQSAGMAFEDAIFLTARTLQSRIEMAIVAQTKALEDGRPSPVKRETVQEDQRISQKLLFSTRKNRIYRIEKIVSVYTSRDFAISDPLEAAKKLLLVQTSFADLREKHSRVWGFLWRRFNISLREMVEETRILRLHIFHLLQTSCHNSVGRDVSVPARGLHGEAYRGHIFWDEMFIFPLIYFRMPELARSLLMYRYRRLDEARCLARNQGYEGAMYPWQSGSDGREETQEIHLNPESGRWIPDNTHKQRHINGAVAYNIVKYFEATEDREFISNYGAEMMLEMARFWVNYLQYNHKKKRYEILGVVGPDEFHTLYPGSEELGINNNAYTNFLAAWTIKKVLHLLNNISKHRKEELLKKLSLTTGDLLLWMKVGKLIFIPFMKDGLIEQFEEFESLQEIDWKSYTEKYGDVQRMDRILEAEGDDVNKYKVNKQGDVLMLLYLFSMEEIREIFDWLGYEFGPEDVPKNIKYYLSHTSNGSSLSRIVHAWVLSRSDRRHAWSLFKEALQSDIADIQGGTTSEGIHLGAMSGTVDIVQRCFTGLQVKNDVLWFEPQLPQELKGISFSFCYRGHWLNLELDHDYLSLEVERSWEPKGKLGFKNNIYDFEEGSVFKFSVRDGHSQAHLSGNWEWQVPRPRS